MLILPDNVQEIVAGGTLYALPRLALDTEIIVKVSFR